MLSELRSARPRLWTMFAAVLLPLVAGTVDGQGLTLFGFFVSHMTGNTARLGVELDAHHWQAVRDIACGVLSFAGGAMLSAVVMELPGRRVRRRFAVAFAIEACVLSVAAYLLGPWGAHSPTLLAADLLALGMGLQNGVTSRINGLVVRTTHMTGVVTDIGLAFGRKLVGAELAPDQPGSGSLHVVIYVSFLIGCASGAGLVRLFGWLAPIVPAVVMIALAIFDALASVQPRAIATR
jgi:uncharacterized membrane protein YoaK (UPF0700 family)